MKLPYVFYIGIFDFRSFKRFSIIRYNSNKIELISLLPLKEQGIKPENKLTK